MKSFSVIAFAALFLVAVSMIDWFQLLTKIFSIENFRFGYDCIYKAVSAAPQRTPYPTIKEVIYELTSIFRCVPNVVGKTIGEGDFKPEYKEFKEYFGNVLEKLPECQDLQSLNQRYKFVWKLKCVRNASHNNFYSIIIHTAAYTIVLENSTMFLLVWLIKWPW